MKKQNNGYVVYCRERLQDGTEYYAKVFGEIAHALEYMEDRKSKEWGCILEFELYELGKKIEFKTVEEEVVTEKKTVKTKYKVT